jgi:hypothetical protein
MTKKNILKKKQQLKNNFTLNYCWKEEEIIEEIIDDDNDEKRQENMFLLLKEELIEIKKNNIKSWVKENKNDINFLEHEYKNILLNLIKDKLY